MHKSILIIFIFSFFQLSSTAQSEYITLSKRIITENDINTEIYNCALGKDTFDFFVTRKKDVKNLYIYLPGSLPYPALVRSNDKISFIWNSSLIHDDSADLLCLGKTMVPVLIDQCKLDSNLLFLDKNGKPFSKYMLADNLDWYTLNYNKVIDFISERNNYERITIIGGSQGARIALELALNESITGLVFMNCDPLGRIASRIDAEYSNLETRNINRIESYLNIAKCKTNTLDSLQMNDTQYSWMSFSKPCLLTFAVLNIPTLIVYSDRDSNCPNCYVYDLLPNYKSNIELLKCPGLNHFQIDSEGINHEDSIFEEVNRWMNLKNQIK